MNSKCQKQRQKWAKTSNNFILHNITPFSAWIFGGREGFKEDRQKKTSMSELQEEDGTLPKWKLPAFPGQADFLSLNEP